VLSRNPDLTVVADYPVPDTASGAGNQVMLALETVPGRPFDSDSFAAWFLFQADFDPMWLPRYVRVSSSLPQTATGQVTKVGLRSQAWVCDEPVWWRPLDSSEVCFERLTDDDRRRLGSRRTGDPRSVPSSADLQPSGNRLSTATLTPELYPVPVGPEAAETRTYCPSGTVVLFHSQIHPKRVGVAVQITGAS
jgi:hypothetical protein